jgi:CO/xanthine dehydrogenase Mo-binding subunit
MLHIAEVLVAQNLPGVRAVLRYADLRQLLTRDRIALAMPSSAIRFHVDPPVLASDETCYVGEPIALVVAESRSVAEDAAAFVQLELDPLPAVTDIRTALEPSAFARAAPYRAGISSMQFSVRCEAAVDRQADSDHEARGGAA